MAVGVRRALPLNTDCLWDVTRDARSNGGCQGNSGFWGADRDPVTGQHGQGLYG